MFAEPFGKVLNLHAILHSNVSHTSAAQSYEVSATVQSFPYVASQSPDVCPFAANDANRGLHLLGIEVLQLNLVDNQDLGLELHLPTLSGKIVRAFAVYLAGRESWRNLFYTTEELAENLTNEGLSDVFRGIGLVDGFLEVEARRRRSKLKRGNILLDVCLELVDALCGATCTYDHHSRSQRVERTCMAHLELLHAKTMTQLTAYLGDKIEARPVQRLVETKYLSLDEIHFIIPESAPKCLLWRNRCRSI